MGSDYRHFRDEWRNLWDTKFDDKVKAEAIALREFAVLFVDKGDVICDSRNAKPLDFYGIIERHEKESGTRIRPPDPKEGGLGKFIKEEIVAPSAEAKRRRTQILNALKYGGKKPQSRGSQKKGGRGWLNQ
jgi:hypothetical protein